MGRLGFGQPLESSYLDHMRWKFFTSHSGLPYFHKVILNFKILHTLRDTCDQSLKTLLVHTTFAQNCGICSFNSQNLPKFYLKAKREKIHQNLRLYYSSNFVFLCKYLTPWSLRLGSQYINISYAFFIDKSVLLYLNFSIRLCKKSNTF